MAEGKDIHPGKTVLKKTIPPYDFDASQDHRPWLCVQGKDESDEDFKVIAKGDEFKFATDKQNRKFVHETMDDDIDGEVKGKKMRLLEAKDREVDPIKVKWGEDERKKKNSPQPIKPLTTDTIKKGR